MCEMGARGHVRKLADVVRLAANEAKIAGDGSGVGVWRDVSGRLARNEAEPMGPSAKLGWASIQQLLQNSARELTKAQTFTI